MNRGLRAAIPALYSVAILIGFFISTKTGIIIAVVGAVVSSALYAIIARTTMAPDTGRRPPRQRSRAR
jgi:hypothetical protein